MQPHHKTWGQDDDDSIERYVDEMQKGRGKKQGCTNEWRRQNCIGMLEDERVVFLVLCDLRRVVEGGGAEETDGELCGMGTLVRGAQLVVGCKESEKGS